MMAILKDFRKKSISYDDITINKFINSGLVDLDNNSVVNYIKDVHGETTILKLNGNVVETEIFYFSTLFNLDVSHLFIHNHNQYDIYIFEFIYKYKDVYLSFQVPSITLEHFVVKEVTM
jgi:ABC-type Fe3+-citrate transport system substrate-binding protein